MIVDRPPAIHPLGVRDAPFPDPLVFPDGAPILLSSGPTVLSPGKTAALDAVALNSHSDGPVVIDEVHLSTRFSVSRLDGSEINFANPGGILSLQLRAGATQLTNGFVPFWLLGTQIQPNYGEFFEDVADWDNNLSAIHARVRCTSYHWKLPRPLFLPHGAPILATLQRSNGQPNYTRDINVYVSYAGRMLDSGYPTPPMVDIPWVTPFVGVLGTYANNSGSTMQNPFTSPLFVQRMVGRLMVERDDQSALLDDFFGFYNDATVKYVYAKIQDSTGEDVVRDFMEWSAVFDRWRSAWTFNRTLDPREWLALMTRSDAATGGGAAGQVQVHAAVVGFRREAIR